MKNKNVILPWMAFVVCLLTGIVFSLKNLREPDIWWMLRTGEWIWENKSFISADMLSFTKEGNNWINVKWGFEVFIYFLNFIDAISRKVQVPRIADALGITTFTFDCVIKNSFSPDKFLMKVYVSSTLPG